MKYPPSALWLTPPEDLKPRLERCLKQAADRLPSHRPAHIFFRADDIGVPGRQFARLMEIFSRHQTPLALAVVPTWLTRSRWDVLRNLGQDTPQLWCWHQHGWRHVNHETRGKKQEFGPDRLASAIEHDLLRGRKRLEFLMGEDFYPAFTPPWNRCGQETLNHLKTMGYRAISRSRGATPPAPDGLPDVAVNADLHTRKDATPDEGWENLFAELEQAISGGFCGIMIHHQRMNNAAFDFLDLLLTLLGQHNNFMQVSLEKLAGIYETGGSGDS